MAGPRRFDVEDLLIRPGTYFNPETEVLLVVDDSQHLDSDVADEDGGADGEWLLVSNETPLDDHARDELFEAFTARFSPGASGAIAGDEDDPGEIDPELEADEET